LGLESVFPALLDTKSDPSSWLLVGLLHCQMLAPAANDLHQVTRGSIQKRERTHPTFGLWLQEGGCRVWWIAANDLQKVTRCGIQTLCLISGPLGCGCRREGLLEGRGASITHTQQVTWCGIQKAAPHPRQRTNPECETITEKNNIYFKYLWAVAAGVRAAWRAGGRGRRRPGRGAAAAGSSPPTA
jgi:hypothetical protein